MGWQDRDYSRGYRGGGGVLGWLLSGSVPLFGAAGIDVRAHSSLVLYALLGLTIGIGDDFGYSDKIASVFGLFTIVLLHEFGHCFACRWAGGQADQIIMHPLGGLALCMPPHRPLPTFLTVAGGPAVNVLICLVCGLIVANAGLSLPLNPFRYYPSPVYGFGWGPGMIRYAYWSYEMSYSLLLFNLLPFYPLDGGQMLQAALWPKLGFYRSMKLSTEIGMGGAVVAAVSGLASHNPSLVILAVLGFATCYYMRAQLVAQGFGDLDAVSYAVGPTTARRTKRTSWVTGWRQRRAAAAEVSEAAAVDRILEKVARTGMNSLTGGEKRTLHRASENQRRRDLQRGRR